jgi:hypothetical protein
LAKLRLITRLEQYRDSLQLAIIHFIAVLNGDCSLLTQVCVDGRLAKRMLLVGIMKLLMLYIIHRRTGPYQNVNAVYTKAKDQREIKNDSLIRARWVGVE